MTEEVKNNAQEPTIIKNTSQAYGYKYSSLADISNAGVSIPLMRVKPTEFGDYIEYLDDNGNWQTGAKIVVPEMKGSNSAQAYGSAITYARRYTTHLAKRIACDDDAKLEKQPPQNNKYQNSKQVNKPVQKIDQGFLCKVRGKLPTIDTNEELDSYWKELNLNKQYQAALLSAFKQRRGEIANAMEG